MNNICFLNVNSNIPLLLTFQDSMGLEVDNEEVEKLVLYTTKELQEFRRKQKEAIEKFSSENKGLSKCNIFAVEIKKLCFYWCRIHIIAENWCPDIAIVSNDNIITYFRKILKKAF